MKLLVNIRNDLMIWQLYPSKTLWQIYFIIMMKCRNIKAIWNRTKTSIILIENKYKKFTTWKSTTENKVARENVPSTGWSANDKLYTGWTERANIRGMTPVRVDTAFHADWLGTWYATAAGTCSVRRLRRLMNRRVALTRNRNRLRNRQVARSRRTDGFPARLSVISGK